jgi:hypothetical protein
MQKPTSLTQPHVRVLLHLLFHLQEHARTHPLQLLRTLVPPLCAPLAQVHWVLGDAHLVGALARVPLRLQLLCLHEPTHHHHRASPGQSSQAGHASVLGCADVDLSPLVAPGPQGKQLPAK